MSTKRETLTLVSFTDPALHASESTTAELLDWAWDRKTKTRESTREALKIPAGHDPMLFSFRRLRRKVLHQFVESATTDAERFERAFMAAITKVEGGRFSEPWVPTGADESSFVAMSEDELEDNFSLAEARDVGQWIYAHSVLGKGSAPRLRPLPSSLAAFDAHGPRSAVQSVT